MAGRSILPRKELDRLGYALSYFLIQRDLAKPISILKQTLADLKFVTVRIIKDYYIPLPADLEDQFMEKIAAFLSNIHAEIVEEGLDEEYCIYCTSKILSAFETAMEMKHTSPSKLVLDDPLINISILESFDLKLRPLIRLVKSDPNNATKQY